MKGKVKRLQRLEKIRGRVRDAALAKARRSEAELRENVGEQQLCLKKISSLSVDSQESVDSIAWAYARLKQLQVEARQMEARTIALRKQYHSTQFELERSRRVRAKAEDELHQLIATSEAAQLDEWASFQHGRRKQGDL